MDVNNSFCAAQYQMTHGPVLVCSPGVGDHWFKGRVDLTDTFLNNVWSQLLHHHKWGA